jgi:geranylgeranyl diphosphate synthase, type II
VPISPSNPPRGPDILARHARAVEQYFDSLAPRLAAAPPRLIEAIRYSLEAGGKRLRPALVLESHDACAAVTGTPDRASGLAAAAAMELVHTFSLVHDDLPAMDDDDLRRGKPTNHKVFGEAMAILAGDAMITLAFEVIAADANPQRSPQLIRQVAAAAGPEGMIGGQVLDIAAEGRALNLDELRNLHRMKTGALITASCRLGAIAAGACEAHLAAVTSFGRHLGLAFQIIDDVLDVEATPEQLGKATQKDADRGKNTYPALLGVAESRAEGGRQARLAAAALEPLGNAAAGLAALAAFVIDRQH